MVFENALVPQPLDGFWFPTPEMKAMNAYVPFLLSKPLNKNEIWELFWDINWKNNNGDFLNNIYVEYFSIYITE